MLIEWWKISWAVTLWWCITVMICLIFHFLNKLICLFGFASLSTLQVISQRVVGRWKGGGAAEETSTYSLLGLCTVNCRPTASNYQLSHLRPWQESIPGFRGGRRECYHSATVAPLNKLKYLGERMCSRAQRPVLQLEIEDNPIQSLGLREQFHQNFWNSLYPR